MSKTTSIVKVESVGQPVAQSKDMTTEALMEYCNSPKVVAVMQEAVGAVQRAEPHIPYFVELRSRLTQKEWDTYCRQTFNRGRRAIDYWMVGGNPRSKRKPSMEVRAPKPSPALPAVQVPKSGTSETLTETYHVIRRKSDGGYLMNDCFYEDELSNVVSLECQFEGKGGSNDEEDTLEGLVRAALKRHGRTREGKRLQTKREDCEVIKVKATYTLTPVAEPLRPPPRGGHRLKKKNPCGVYTYSSTHALLNPTVTFCDIYYNDDPKAQFYGTCKIVTENPKCPRCKWGLERRAQVSTISRGQKHEHQ